VPVAGAKGWHVGPVGPDAAAALAELHALCFAPLPETPWSQDAFRTLLSMPTTVALAGLAPDGSAAGLLIGRSTGADAEILTLCVAPPARRGGLARALFAGFVAHTGPEADIALEVAVGNGPAVALYESLGFRVAGRRPGYYAGRGERVDALIMVHNGKNRGGQPGEEI
jgi:ribosomal-protein-alanine N-acetyltransferase